MKIYFVILHYQDLDSTVRSVLHIEKLLYNNVLQIIIVDNASPNKSGIDLLKKYKNNTNIQVILNEKNIGFAQGNNIGYILAKQCNADLIIVQNSDVMIEQVDFLKLLDNENLLSKYHIIGPDIIDKQQQKHQNPFNEIRFSDKKLNSFLLQNWISSRLIYRNNIIGNIYLKSKKIFGRLRNRKEIIKKFDINQENVSLHGSCIIFTKLWIDKEDFAFLPITYMYMEEEVLYEYILKKEYKSLYLSDLHVVHEGNGSLNASTKNEIEKRKFKSNYMYNSLIQLKKMRKNN